MIVDYGNRAIGLKIVFFGPAMSGKTTSVRWLFSALGCLDQLTSIENTVGRTMFCDFGIISIPIAGAWTINAHVWTATGQDFYRATREVVMAGTDGIVFVADSQRHLIRENAESWRELLSLIDQQDRILPVVILLNKQDIPNPIHEDELREQLNLPLAVPVFETIAKEGVNILEAFRFLFESAMRANLLTQASL
ncbi:MAG: GTP-binding protein [Candidatus Thorarchaeota archaeon]